MWKLKKMYRVIFSQSKEFDKHLFGVGIVPTHVKIRKTHINNGEN